MLGLFRTLRRRFLNENKFSRYLVYAIGEIVLIVIGILIALGINNWNQQRLIRVKEQFYLTSLKSEFESSKVKLENLIEVNKLNYDASRKIAGFINNDEMQPDEKELSTLLLQAFSYDIEYHPNNSLLNEMINSGSLNNISNTSLRMYLTSWESRIQEIHRQERTLYEQRERIIDIFRTNAGSIRTIFDDAEISTQEMGLEKSQNNASNLELLQLQEFENNLLMFILTGITTETVHYLPLLNEINTILALIDGEIDN